MFHHKLIVLSSYYGIGFFNTKKILDQIGYLKSVPVFLKFGTQKFICGSNQNSTYSLLSKLI